MTMNTKLAALAALGALVAGPVLAKDIGGVPCTTQTSVRCDGVACSTDGSLANLGNATDPKTGRKFFLDYPCDLKPNEKVTFILNIHGAGSIGNWERHYFPAADYVQKYRLVVATPTAATLNNFPGATGPGVRMWVANADDAHLQNITDWVFENFGKQNIKA